MSPSSLKLNIEKNLFLNLPFQFGKKTHIDMYTLLKCVCNITKET